MSDYRLHIGDALEQLRTLPSDSVHCCVTSPPYFGLRAYLPVDHPDRVMEIGLEYTPDQYVTRLVEVFREVRRVLHPTGTCWINIGDSYNGSGGAGGDYGPGGLKEGQPKYPGRNVNGLGPKQLLGIPWRLAFALQADGWILRSEIIWHKTAPMPESVTDRCTKAHEQVFLLAKSERYFFDAEAIREPMVSEDRVLREAAKGMTDVLGFKRDASRNDTNGGMTHAQMGARQSLVERGGRNKRSVWTLGPESYSGAHYAVMPTKLVEPCVLAGTSAHGCCSKCGSPYERIVEKEMPPLRKVTTNGPIGGHGLLGGNRFDEPIKTTTTGWSPTCTCQAPVQPCVVLDPFAGSGTVLAVALKFGRRAIGIDLDPRNLALATQRIEQTQPLLLNL